MICIVIATAIKLREARDTHLLLENTFLNSLAFLQSIFDATAEERTIFIYLLIG